MKVRTKVVSVHKTSGARMLRKGQSAVEFALVLVVLMAILYGILEISRLLLVNAEIENGAKEGAQYASLHPTVSTADLKTDIIGPKVSLSSAEIANLVVTKCFPVSGTAGPFHPVRVRVNYHWTSLARIMPNMRNFTLQPLSVDLQATSIKLIEDYNPLEPADGVCN
jgi:hypothetical protein